MNEQLVNGPVSRETLQKLHIYCDLIRRWNPRINLVAASTIDDLWSRHIEDSMQIVGLAPSTPAHWVDLGSGGGLPGVVCAIMSQELAPNCHFTLVESDKRKAAFLATCKHELALNMTVKSERAERLEPQRADVVSARALAPLPALLPLVARHMANDAIALLPKGKNHAAELEAARAEWQFTLASHVSQTDNLARILALRDIKRV